MSRTRFSVTNFDLPRQVLFAATHTHLSNCMTGSQVIDAEDDFITIPNSGASGFAQLNDRGRSDGIVGETTA